MTESSITINLGDAFLLDIPTTGNEHLYIAIAKTTDEQYLFVNVTTRRANSETTCILNPGVGVPSFVKHESVIPYNFAREMNAEDLESLITEGSPIPKESCSPDILKEIQQGGLISKRLPKKLKTVLKEFLENDKT
jgi:hypothetical protein